ncbi:bifunctional lysylphosphatidylglycerol flippase/synthetase MprF [Rhodovulum sulfidophilum]|uniref:bifunctional lysylphosphatidylglycerol flippase/synthetase MprF n=1 Tax=Rhodovulum sulfidophilum TaxID=35806 RepID=UPI0009D716F7|nr:bifunctional lysylphosphatidylglycerol flippase/synthetase MprF [Rhodovulum sulfidophilum]MBL3553215.1 bifunctional lysylphosphatidylglycerol flippase/synthetase MprF [Rhodovulum sulfidophilum]MBL3573026.1 bifunctional lysylphosphatidylglycerol flippase/synthetase MprF [Rhodovulum sulfidophilum]MCE8430652.1 bifunctional lysylphosphatidylglycerol flippase/synthetase MprF [Rhodovulum sulfidophilum]MCF4116873.1 bifunctional lysylphosphatidylglycerol flippase/synthetase MprF [Rhodovulum sulfidop
MGETLTEDARPETASARHWGRLRAVFPYVLAAGLFVLGLLALYRLLATVDFADVVAQVRATPWSTVGLALAATAASYVSLVGYDWSALRFIGKPLNFPVVLAGGFMAYAFGNTIGLSAVSGGAVRWRIYSALGLDGYDVAAVSTFAAVSFGVAATLVGLGALAVHPAALAAMLPLAPGTVQVLALGGMAVIALPLLWASVRQRRVRLGRFTLRAPVPRDLAAQLIFCLGDIGFAAATLYLLLPANDLGFATFLALFAAATMAGVLSHVPGGVGVFEAVVIAAMPAATPISAVAASLLLYRLIYFLVPFFLALLALAGYELFRSAGGHLPRGQWGRALGAVDPAFRAVERIAPMVLGTMILGAGLWMSVASILPPATEAARAAEALFPLPFIEGSALASSVIGSALVLISFGVMRRALAAFWLAVAVMEAGAAVALVQGVDLDRAVLLATGALLLLPFRHAFHRHTMLSHATLTPAWAALIVALIAGFGFMLFFAHKETPYAHELWWQFAVNERAPRALRAGLLGSLVLGLGALLILLRAPRVAAEPPAREDLDRAARIAAGGDNPDAGFALTGDKSILVSDDGRAFVMFAVSGRSWIAYGGPVGPADAAEDVAFAFVDAARRAGARPAFYEVRAADVPVMLDLGLSLHKMGEEAVVDLTAFSLEGSARKKLRAAHARALRDGLSLGWAEPPHAPAFLAELGVVSEAWLSAKRAREKGFSVGRFDPDWLNRWPVATVRQDGRVVAFANVLVTDSRAQAAIDLMRHVEHAPSGTMEFLFTALMLRLKEEGHAAFSLGMAPLSGLSPERSRRLWDRFGALIYRHGRSFYNFEGLRAFKAKFDPDWRPRYLAAPSALPPLLTLADAARLIGGRNERRQTLRRKADRGEET